MSSRGIEGRERLSGMGLAGGGGRFLGRENGHWVGLLLSPDLPTLGSLPLFTLQGKGHRMFYRQVEARDDFRGVPPGLPSHMGMQPCQPS